MCYSSEPPADNPLIGLPNVLHTPHLGASSIEAQREVATQIVEQVVDALRGA
jgi:D-3-phosphoglycerate dehydrogenase / 2-oxoglutarate reductase